MARYVINPNNRYKIVFDVVIGFLYLYTYILDPLNFAF